MKRRPETQVTVWPAITDLMTAIVVIAVLAGIIGYSKYIEIDSIAAKLPETRNHILDEIDSLLKESNITVEVLNDEGVLRLSDGVVNFASGEIEPVYQHKANVGKLAHVLAQVVPCYISDPPQTNHQISIYGNSTDRSYCQSRTNPAYTCNDSNKSSWLIGTILIEGHTDIAPVIGGKHRFKDNLELSSMRAAEVYRMITNCEASIGQAKNSKGVPIFSTSGYGEMRLAEPDYPLNAKNRRIDIRFLLERSEDT